MRFFNTYVVENVAFGEQDGYLYSAAYDRSMDDVLVRFVVDGSPKSAAKSLRKKKRPYIRWFWEKDALSQGGVLVALVDTPSEFYLKSTIHTLLGDAVTALQKENLKPPVVCPLCGKPATDSLAFLNSGYRHTHAHCVKEQHAKAASQDSTEPIKKGNYFTGAIGALIGAFIAVLPNWSQAISKNKISPILYALIPVFAALMYRVFRGRKNRIAVLVTVLATSFLAAFALELVWYWIIVTNDAGVNLSIAYTTSLYFKTHTFLSALREMVFCLLFLAIGLFPAAVIMRRYTASGTKRKSVVRGTEFSEKTLRPATQFVETDEKTPNNKDDTPAG